MRKGSRSMTLLPSRCARDVPPALDRSTTGGPKPA